MDTLPLEIISRIIELAGEMPQDPLYRDWEARYSTLCRCSLVARSWRAFGQTQLWRYLWLNNSGTCAKLLQSERIGREVSVEVNLYRLRGKEAASLLARLRGVKTLYLQGLKRITPDTWSLSSLQGDIALGSLATAANTSCPVDLMDLCTNACTFRPSPSSPSAPVAFQLTSLSLLDRHTPNQLRFGDFHSLFAASASSLVDLCLPVLTASADPFSLHLPLLSNTLRRLNIATHGTVPPLLEGLAQCRRLDLLEYRGDHLSLAPILRVLPNSLSTLCVRDIDEDAYDPYSGWNRFEHCPLFDYLSLPSLSRLNRLIIMDKSHWEKSVDRLLLLECENRGISLLSRPFGE
jgi:hypothetical protein